MTSSPSRDRIYIFAFAILFSLVVAAVSLVLRLTKPDEIEVTPQKQESAAVNSDRKISYATQTSRREPIPSETPSSSPCPSNNAIQYDIEPTPPLMSKNAENAIAAIQAAFPRRDKAALGLISSHLMDSESAVRSAAREGLMQLSDTDAIPYLQKAAEQTQDSDEANEIQAAIEFIETPPLNVAEYKKKLEQAAQKNAAQNQAN